MTDCKQATLPPIMTVAALISALAISMSAKAADLPARHILTLDAARSVIAAAKARTAALFRKPSKALEDAIHAGRTAAVTAGFVEMGGGLPLNVNGEIVGAIGVSSAQPDWDVEIAAAGAAVLTSKP